MKKSKPTTPLRETIEALPPENHITVISADGDLVLRVQHMTSDFPGSDTAFRVSVDVLRAKSKYFDRLLEPSRFGEGQRVAKRHDDLRAIFRTVSDVPVEELPIVRVQDLGRISEVKSIRPLLTDLLNVLHDKETPAIMPAANLANLAIVADRFDALQVLQSYVRRKKYMAAIDSKTSSRQELSLSEERVRHRLIVALMLDYPPWIERYSLRLIVRGWLGREAAITEPLWWDLPGRVEEELLLRRTYVLETIQSVQDHFLALYSTRNRVCRLGYDSSPECDSFQLGETVKFFLRAGTLRLQGIVTGTVEDDITIPYAGDVAVLFDKLKQVPEYQVNTHHSHCGIRTHYVPILQLIESTLPHVALCGQCWVEDRHSYAWLNAKRPLKWTRGTSNLSLRSTDHASRHAETRDLFTGTAREWAS